MKKILKLVPVLFVGVAMINVETRGSERPNAEELWDAFDNGDISWGEYCDIMKAIGEQPRDRNNGDRQPRHKNDDVTQEELELSKAMYESEKAQKQDPWRTVGRGGTYRTLNSRQERGTSDDDTLWRAFERGEISWDDYCALTNAISKGPSKGNDDIPQDVLAMSKTMYESEQEHRRLLRQAIESRNKYKALYTSQKEEEERKKRAKEEEEEKIKLWESIFEEDERRALAAGISSRVEGYGDVNLEEQRNILTECERRKQAQKKE